MEKITEQLNNNCGRKGKHPRGEVPQCDLEGNDIKTLQFLNCIAAFFSTDPYTAVIEIEDNDTYYISSSTEIKNSSNLIEQIKKCLQAPDHYKKWYNLLLQMQKSENAKLQNISSKEESIKLIKFPKSSREISKIDGIFKDLFPSNHYATFFELISNHYDKFKNCNFEIINTKNDVHVEMAALDYLKKKNKIKKDNKVFIGLANNQPSCDPAPCAYCTLQIDALNEFGNQLYTLKKAPQNLSTTYPFRMPKITEELIANIDAQQFLVEQYTKALQLFCEQAITKLRKEEKLYTTNQDSGKANFQTFKGKSNRKAKGKLKTPPQEKKLCIKNQDPSDGKFQTVKGKSETKAESTLKTLANKATRLGKLRNEQKSLHGSSSKKKTSQNMETPYEEEKLLLSEEEKLLLSEEAKLSPYEKEKQSLSEEEKNFSYEDEKQPSHEEEKYLENEWLRNGLVQKKASNAPPSTSATFLTPARMKWPSNKKHIAPLSKNAQSRGSNNSGGRKH